MRSYSETCLLPWFFFFVWINSSLRHLSGVLLPSIGWWNNVSSFLFISHSLDKICRNARKATQFDEKRRKDGILPSKRLSSLVYLIPRQLYPLLCLSSTSDTQLTAIKCTLSTLIWTSTLVELDILCPKPGPTGHNGFGFGSGHAAFLNCSDSGRVPVQRHSWQMRYWWNVRFGFTQTNIGSDPD